MDIRPKAKRVVRTDFADNIIVFMPFSYTRVIA